MHFCQLKNKLQKLEKLQTIIEKKEKDMKVFFVVPDYFATRPKSMYEWLGNYILTINPDGIALSPYNTANTFATRVPKCKRVFS